MAGVRLKHVERFRDRHGKLRFYYRLGKGNRIALQGQPGTGEFMQSFENAAQNYGKKTSNDKTFYVLANLYYRSRKFIKLQNTSKLTARQTIDQFLREHGHRRVDQLTPKLVEMLLTEKADKPGRANLLLQYLKLLCKLAYLEGWIKSDPTAGAKRFKLGRIHTWTEAEIDQFENHWALGTKERTAFALHLYTAQRRADICKLLWANIGKDEISLVQQKTGVSLTIPLHRELTTALTVYRDELSNVSGAIVGELARYTEEADQKRLARDALEGLGKPKIS